MVKENFFLQFWGRTSLFWNWDSITWIFCCIPHLLNQQTANLLMSHYFTTEIGPLLVLFSVCSLLQMYHGSRVHRPRRIDRRWTAASPRTSTGPRPCPSTRPLHAPTRRRRPRTGTARYPASEGGPPLEITARRWVSRTKLTWFYLVTLKLSGPDACRGNS